MKNWFFAPRSYDEPDRIEGFEPHAHGCRTIALATVLFWVAVFGGIVWFIN